MQLTDFPETAIIRVNGFIVDLRMTPAIFTHFGIQPTDLLDIWTSSVSDWRVVCANQPIEIERGENNMLGRLHDVARVPHFAFEI